MFKTLIFTLHTTSHTSNEKALKNVTRSLQVFGKLGIDVLSPEDLEQDFTGHPKWRGQVLVQNQDPLLSWGAICEQINTAQRGFFSFKYLKRAL
jgi:hypothetical protein